MVPHHLSRATGSGCLKPPHAQSISTIDILVRGGVCYKHGRTWKHNCIAV
jgi:hypothetical protein